MSVIYLAIWWGGQSVLNPAFLRQTPNVWFTQDCQLQFLSHFLLEHVHLFFPFASTEILPNIPGVFKVLKYFFFQVHVWKGLIVPAINISSLQLLHSVPLRTFISVTVLCPICF